VLTYLSSKPDYRMINPHGEDVPNNRGLIMIPDANVVALWQKPVPEEVPFM